MVAIPTSLDQFTSLTSSVLRLGSGYVVRRGQLGPRPAKRLELYEFEACPFCRRVREALTELDLEATIYPCPKRGTRFRSVVLERGGKNQYPYLVDPNTGDALYESDHIVRHLYAQYGRGGVPVLTRINHFAAPVASIPRAGHGGRAVASRAPAEPLVLYSFEASPFCRVVREVLSELELPYVLHNVGKRSPGRAAFRELSGRMMVPYLIDPNEGTSMFESKDIVRYLRTTYATAD